MLRKKIKYIGQGNEKIMLFRYIKRSFFSIFKSILLISKKVTKDKRVVTYFIHLNVRIAKNDLSYLFLKYTCSVLGSTRCEVLSLVDLKDTFYLLRLSENSERYYGILAYFGSTSYLYQRMSMGLNISPSIWQSHINAILDCLQSRKYCKAIMDNLLLFIPMKKLRITKLDFLKMLLKNGLKISPKKWQLLSKHYNIWEMLYSLRTRECVLNYYKVA